MIPVFSPVVDESDIASVTAALARGEISGNFGEALTAFETEFAERVGCRYGITTTSGTTALHLALATADIGRGDEVIVSSSTNIATALAAVYTGAVPVPADVDPATWNLDVAHVESLITPRTRAIIPVHLFGLPVDMDALMAVAGRHGLLVLEDASQAHGAAWHGRPAGSFGQMAAFSFYANKIITTGEGGMVTTNDEALMRRLRHLRNLAFTVPRFRHEEIGFNYRMPGFQAALGLSQLRRMDATIAAKRDLYRLYRSELEGVPGIQWQDEPAEAFHVHWMAALRILPDARANRDQLAEGLSRRGIETRTFFCPMNQQPCLLDLPGFTATPCPVADRLWADGLYLPSATSLEPEQVRQVAQAIRDMLG